jgi:protoheme IX farnesyltransferase
MGWIAGGGNMPDQEILVICFLFFMWQVPHFWLLILSHGADYEKAGLPSLNNIFTARQLARITFSWNCAAAVACLLIPFYGVSSSVITGVCLAGVALWIILNGIRIVRQKDNTNVYPLIFNKINVFILIIMLLISIEKIVYALI